MTLVVVEAFLPIMKILREVHVLLHLPYLLIMHDNNVDSAKHDEENVSNNDKPCHWMGKRTKRLFQKGLVVFLIQVDFANKTRAEVPHRVLLRSRGFGNDNIAFVIVRVLSKPL